MIEQKEITLKGRSPDKMGPLRHCIEPCTTPPFLLKSPQTKVVQSGRAKANFKNKGDKAGCHATKDLASTCLGSIA